MEYNEGPPIKKNYNTPSLSSPSSYKVDLIYPKNYKYVKKNVCLFTQDVLKGVFIFIQI